MSESGQYIFLPLDFDQLYELAKQLPVKEKLQLVDMLLKEDAAAESNIPESQKQLVRERIIKYSQHPEMLIAEEDALERF